MLNILPLIDISVWKAKHFKGLIDIIAAFSEETFNKNNLMLTSNPIMSIALAADLLDTIGEKCKKLENESIRVRNEILELGRLYTSKIEDEEFYEKLLMQEDFQGRSLIKIITQNKYEPLMEEEDPKAENIIGLLWDGIESTKCDGNIYGYSSFMHILSTGTTMI